MKEWRMEGGKHKCEVCSTVGFLRVKRTNILILLLTGFGSVGVMQFHKIGEGCGEGC